MQEFGMFGSQERAVVDLKSGEMCKLFKLGPVRAGRKEVLKPMWCQMALVWGE